MPWLSDGFNQIVEEVLGKEAKAVLVEAALAGLLDESFGLVAVHGLPAVLVTSSQITSASPGMSSKSLRLWVKNR